MCLSSIATGATEQQDMCVCVWKRGWMKDLLVWDIPDSIAEEQDHVAFGFLSLALRLSYFMLSGVISSILETRAVLSKHE